MINETGLPETRQLCAGEDIQVAQDEREGVNQIVGSKLKRAAELWMKQQQGLMVGNQKDARSVRC